LYTATDLTQLIAKIAAKKDVKPNERLWHDLKIGGEDAHEIIMFVHKNFEVNFDDFVFNDYFPDEGLSFRDVAAKVRKFPLSSKKELTVADLLQMIQTKRFIQRQ
jgi:hypothetical protein